MLPDVLSKGKTWIKTFIIYSHLVIYIGSVFLNAAEIISIVKRRNRRATKTIDAVLLNVASSDFLTGVFGTLAWTLSHTGPYTHAYFIPVDLCRYSSILAFLLLSLDRYIMVKYPMQYHLNKSSILVTMAVLLSWMSAGLVKVIQEIMYSGCPVYATALLFAFAPIWILLVALNVLTHKELRRHRQKTIGFKHIGNQPLTVISGIGSEESSTGDTTGNKRTSTPDDSDMNSDPANVDSVIDCSSISGIVTTQQQHDVTKQDRRDITTCVLSTLAFVLLTMPDTIVSTMSTFADDLYHYMDREKSLIAVSLLNLRSVITPSIYFYQQHYRRK